jgi:chloramphenicol 3-O phosphotransferase
MSRLLILNGPSSSGKSSIAREMQKILPGTFLHYPLDAFLNMLPEAAANYEAFAQVAQAMDKAAIAFLQDGHNLIIDTVSIDGSVARMRENFKPYAPFMVGVKTSPDVLAQREKDRGDREIGLAASQINHVHRSIVYDFEIDTSDITAAEAAQKIVEAYLTARP